MSDQTALSCSVNEVEMLALKAARGNGAHPAQAAHFGKAFVYGLALGEDMDALIAVLDAAPDGAIQTLCIVPELDLNDAAARCYATLRLPSDQRPDLPQRLLCPPHILRRLQDDAARTFVPNSESSRAGGAGAGLSDND